MKRIIPVFNIVLTLLLSSFLLVQSVVAATDIHINLPDDVVSLHHVDSYNSLTHHTHLDQDSDQTHIEHCCHAYSIASIAATPYPLITVINNMTVFLPLYNNHYLPPYLSRLQRPPKA